MQGTTMSGLNMQRYNGTKWNGSVTRKIPQARKPLRCF
jgi:hypothetical protein